MQDRLAVHLDLDVERRALEPIGEVLFPREDVAARGLRRLFGLEIARVVPDDPARQVQPERDDSEPFQPTF